MDQSQITLVEALPPPPRPTGITTMTIGKSRVRLHLWCGGKATTPPIQAIWRCSPGNAGLAEESH
jgi:hypothetical protein